MKMVSLNVPAVIGVSFFFAEIYILYFLYHIVIYSYSKISFRFQSIYHFMFYLSRNVKYYEIFQ